MTTNPPPVVVTPHRVPDPSAWTRFLGALLRINTDGPDKAPMPWAFMTLKTGVPGSGKSLTIVDEMRAACEGENPPTIYVHGIADLALPYIPLPVFAPLVEQKGESGKPEKVFSRTLEVDWAQVVPGSLVVIDEAQHVFPVRSSTGKIPGYVSFLNTHRHKAIVIVLITQHPKNIDQKVRVLVGKHQHYRRVFGGGRHICYEWDSCSDNLSSMKTATKSLRSFPKKAFAAYKSAELHHKPKFSTPVWLAVPVLAVVGLLAVAPTTYKALYGAFTGKGVVGVSGEVPEPAPALPGAPAALPNGGKGLTPQQLTAWRPAPAVKIAAYPAHYVQPEAQPEDIGGCWIADQCICALNGPPGRLVRNLGQLCVDIAMGNLAANPARSALALAGAASSPAYPSPVVPPPTAAASAPGKPAAGA